MAGRGWVAHFGGRFQALTVVRLCTKGTCPAPSWPRSRGSGTAAVIPLPVPAQRAAFSGAQAPSSGSRGSGRGARSRGLSPQPCTGLCYGLLLPAPGSPPALGCGACAQWSLRLQCLAECSSKHAPLSGCPLTPHPSQLGEVMKHRTSNLGWQHL